MENLVLQTIRQRRSIRKYQPVQVEDELLAQILNAGRQAPSAMNHRTNHFLVVQNHERLAELAGLVGREFFYSAPTLVLVANRRDYVNAMADCSTAMQNMMLAAAALDVGSCWINQLRHYRDSPEANELFRNIGMGEEEAVYCALALGYAQEAAALPESGGNTITFIK